MDKINDGGKRISYGENKAVREPTEGKGDMYSIPAIAILRLSKHYELGAKKYAQKNFMKGIPTSRCMDSALRHMFKYLAGMDDEDHLSAAAFNILATIYMELEKPEMQDIEERKGKNIFAYEVKE